MDRNNLIEAIRAGKARETDLVGADLEGADLRWTNLRAAYLHGANLSGANLRAAYLHGANLSDASLRDADLSGANLRDASLRDADLSGANLRGTNLRGADLGGTYLEGANLRGAILSSADLETLDSVPWARVGFGSHGERGRSLLMIDTGRGPLFHCGCFWGTEADLVGYIAEGDRELAETRMNALEAVKMLYAAELAARGER